MSGSTFVPVFSRSEVAKILNCTPLTMQNREKNGKYPQPQRGPNGYRQYRLEDIYALQQITYNGVFFAPILSVLWDKFKKLKNPPETAEIEKLLADSLELFKQKVGAAKAGALAATQSDVVN